MPTVLLRTIMRLTRHPLLPAGASLGTIPVDEEVVSRLERSARLLEAVWPRFAAGFSARLEREIEPGRGRTPQAGEDGAWLLRRLLLLFARDLRSPQVIRTELSALGRRVEAEWLAPRTVARLTAAVMASAREVLGPDFTDEDEEEWTRALELAAVIARAGADGRPATGG